MWLEESFVETLDLQTDERVGPRANYARNVTAGTNGHTRAVLFGHITRRAGFLGKGNNSWEIESKRKRGRADMRWIGSMTAAVGVSVQEPSRAAEDSTSWMSLIHGVTRSRSRLRGM